MNEREKAECRAIVDRMKPDWFRRETQPLLRTLCSLAVQLNDLNEALAALGPAVPSDPVAWDRHRELTKMRCLNRSGPDRRLPIESAAAIAGANRELTIDALGHEIRTTKENVTAVVHNPLDVAAQKLKVASEEKEHA